jgi:hypothetical protein
MERPQRVAVILILTLFLNLALFNTIEAGFGISPPYVMNENLTRGSHFEQKIILVRDDPIEDWKAEITIDAPEIENWLSVDLGKEFILPKGEKTVPIIISVDVPKNADFGRYKGAIRIKTSSLALPAGGTVAIALGGRIEVDLNIAKEIFDFKVDGVKFEDFEEGYKLWFWYIPGKIKFWMNIENVGNIKAAPTKVSFDIYNEEQTEFLESTETTKMKKVETFATEWVLAELPTKLKAGGYWAEYKIYKKDEIVQQAKIHFSILPYGTLPAKPIEFLGLSIRTWAVIALLVLVGIGFGIFGICRKLKRKSSF